MELDQIRLQAAAARLFSVSIAPAVVVDGVQTSAPIDVALRIPTRHESDVAYTRVAFLGGEMDRAAMLRWQRAIVVQAITGWQGVCVSHIVPGSKAAADPVPFDASAIELLLDAQPEWEAALTGALLDAIGKRRAAEDTAAKN